MTYEEKSEIVIRQLREDRDRLLDAIDKIRAEIKTKSGDIETIADVLQIIDKYREERKALDNEDVLEQIRGEIATAYNECSIEDYDYASGLKHAMNVIDKYR